MLSDFDARLKARAELAGVQLEAGLAAGLRSYYHLLFRWNRTINLTALRDSDAAIDRLLVEPLLAARFLPLGCRRLIDLGSGGGSPAIPLALTTPFLALTMVEVKERKSAFLREAVRHLGMSDATVEQSRYEELVLSADHRHGYQAVSARALVPGEGLFSAALELLENNGVFLVFHSPTASEGIRKISEQVGFQETQGHSSPGGSGSVLTVCSRA